MILFSDKINSDLEITTDSYRNMRFKQRFIGVAYSENCNYLKNF